MDPCQGILIVIITSEKVPDSFVTLKLFENYTFPLAFESRKGKCHTSLLEGLNRLKAHFFDKRGIIKTIMLLAHTYIHTSIQFSPLEYN